MGPVWVVNGLKNGPYMGLSMGFILVPYQWPHQWLYPFMLGLPGYQVGMGHKGAHLGKPTHVGNWHRANGEPYDV